MNRAGGERTCSACCSKSGLEVALPAGLLVGSDRIASTSTLQHQHRADAPVESSGKDA